MKMKLSETQLLELRVEMGMDRLNDMTQQYGQNDRRVRNYRKRLEQLLVQTNRLKYCANVSC